MNESMGRRIRGCFRGTTLHRSFVLWSILGFLLGGQGVQSQQITPKSAPGMYSSCLSQLMASDQNGDKLLQANEFLTFVDLRSGGRLNYTSFSALPLPLVSSFNFGACFCALISSDNQCCVGQNASVILNPNISKLVKDNIFAFCLTTSDAIGSLLPATPAPTMAPHTASPTASPSSPPTMATSAPTSRPTVSPTPPNATPFPTKSPTAAPTASPSVAPTLAPTAPSQRPTSANELCITFQYGIVNNRGFNASAIFNMQNNSLKTGLILATTNVTIETLNTTFPRAGGRLLRSGSKDPLAGDGHKYVGGERSKVGQQLVVPLDFFDSHLPSGFEIEASDSAMSDRELAYVAQTWYSKDRSQFARRLVYYLNTVPPEILAIIDNPFCPSSTPAVTKCAIVSSLVCVFLEPGDNATVVRAQLQKGIQASISDGSFQAAIPSRYRIPVV